MPANLYCSAPVVDLLFGVAEAVVWSHRSDEAVAGLLHLWGSFVPVGGTVSPPPTAHLRLALLRSLTGMLEGPSGPVVAEVEAASGTVWRSREQVLLGLASHCYWLLAEHVSGWATEWVFVI